jgi:hypothetical protein
MGAHQKPHLQIEEQAFFVMQDASSMTMTVPVLLPVLNLCFRSHVADQGRDLS